MEATTLEEILLFYRGIILHPDYPLPATGHEEPEIQWHTETRTDGLKGHIYTDGACVPHKIPELARAAAGVVVLNDEGQKPSPEAEADGRILSCFLDEPHLQGWEHRHHLHLPLS